MRTRTRRPRISSSQSLRNGAELSRWQEAHRSNPNVTVATMETPKPTLAAATPSLTDLQVMRSGMATFTLESLKSGTRYTYRVSRVEFDRIDNPADPKKVMYFVNLLTGPDNTADYKTYLGILGDDNRFHLTRNSRLDAQADAVKGARFIFDKLASGVVTARFPEFGARLAWSETCQRCGRVLTVPSSVDARLGPVCAEKVARGE